VWNGRFVNRRKDGTTYTEEATISPVRDATGAVVSYVAVKRDITRELEMEDQLVQAHKMEAVGRLVGGVAHDFNNMLQTILGYGEMTLTAAPEEGPVRENVREMQRAARRAADLTRQLLAFARRQTVAPRVVSLNDLVESSLKMLRRLIGEDIDLAWMPGATWNILIDPSQVDQILANLAVNARDAIAEDGKIVIETANIRVGEAECAGRPGAAPGDYVVLSVSDNGCGMDADTMSHAFEPFFTTKEVGQGTGLGLATVYGIVRQCGGFIGVYSESRMGTTFRIYFPRHSGDASELPGTADTGDAPRGTEGILLVEDEAGILEMGKIMLSRLGYSVQAAATPEEAVRLAAKSETPIDLLLTDVVMPGMNGKALAGHIVARRPGIKVLYMSGYTADAIARRGVLDDGAHFIQKPFSSRELARKVREVLDG
jgi:signal transduction histidine kinase